HSVGVGRFTIGAFIRSVWRKLGFLGIMVEEEENKAKKPDWFPAKMAPALSRLGIVQLKKLDDYNTHRLLISKIYHLYLKELSDSEVLDENRVYLRYPILLKNKEQFVKVWNLSRQLRVTLGNWFEKPLYGSTVDDATYQVLCYVPSLTPETLNKSGLTLNLPTSVNMSKERARELAEEIKKAIF
ncbi:DegT/DnrJ/EryC1/StrS family aminotransferase, partial [Candidatus Dojkabacteria bacterium]|nr:DegT/DnrJ/EryC1/StrS family aminotransferase [Candidatus Dojkabacteria bacterium]